ncbi:MAG: restriction endonuclease subunit S [Trueperaceae bacterium]|nr:restriction endonuclease subunit S [Trueperaceae bacterium]
MARDYMLEDGDVLFARSGATVGKTFMYREMLGPACFAGYLIRFRCDRTKVLPTFLSYFTQGSQYWNQISELMIQATIENVSADRYGNVVLPLPSIRQQRAIADYLDRETARLDALVAAKERILGLLAEKRRALITRAVTRGLDPRARMRDSGIPWLGEIPAHWKTRKIAWLFRERDQRGEPDLPLLEVSISHGVILREFSEERIESTAADYNTYKVARRGDVVFNKMRMWQGAVGVAPEDGLVSPDYVVAAPTGPLFSSYASLLFRTAAFSAESARRSHGIVWDRLRLYWEGFRDIEVPLPPGEEQDGMCHQVDERIGRLDKLRGATQHSIALLKERRSTLIAAAVTGQVDVQEVVA